jgi:Ca2+/H+ antiporter
MERSVWLRRSNLFLLLLIPIVLADRLQLPPPILALMLALCLGVFADFLESAVEELAELLGTFIGGLLHTSFGHIDDLVVGLAVFVPLSSAAASDFVEGAVTGTLALNLLLALATAGLFTSAHGRIRFSTERAAEYSNVLLLAALVIAVPSILHFALAGKFDTLTLPLGANAPLGLAIASVLLAGYVFYILYAVFRVSFSRPTSAQHADRRQKRTRRNGASAIVPVSAADTEALFAEERAAAERVIVREASEKIPQAQRAEARRIARREKGLASDFWEQHRVFRGTMALVILSVAMAGVAYLSIHFNGAVQGALQAYPALSPYQFFIGLIVLPVLLGAGDISAVMEMTKANRVEIVLAVSAGSCIQFLLLVAPLVAVVGAVVGHPLPLIFRPLSLITIMVTVVVFIRLCRSGELSRRSALGLLIAWVALGVAALVFPG